MNTTRMRPFDVPHKGLRNALSQISLLAGKTNYADYEEVRQLHTLGKETFLFLTTHANDEDDVSLKALEEKVPGAAHHNKEEHVKIHHDQSRLEGYLEDILAASESGKDATAEGRTFYQAFHDFYSYYLSHMADEEREIQALLWEHFTDEELIGHRNEIIKRMGPDKLLVLLKYIIPAQAHHERVGLLRGFKANAPEPFFRQVMGVIESVLAGREFAMLQAGLE